MSGKCNRKRGRTEEESAEFVPLSKRINNLHINNFSGLQKIAANSEKSQSENSNIPYTSSYINPLPNSSAMDENSGSSSSSSYISEYRPDLSVRDNPFYYETNRLLFSLHMARMQRSVAY
ncbi:PREDICTED: uncharacterized protein LOC107069544 [Polistes dominula]|uniref:Uncharacterized protein LOC107069544 n=1 Tax=Polistes dominula TaxID=743375 RepID=A0ABM1IQF0_POLDO|nr:PREDICTED: uncharacterized protein LOC107069544 [Polistes dominula]